MNFIGKYIPNSTDFCDDLIELFNTSTSTGPGTVINANGEDLIDTNVKDALSLTVSLADDSKPIQAFNNVLKACVDAYKMNYIYCDKYGPWGVKEPAAILKYLPYSKGFVYHTERFTSKQPSASRHLVFMTYLNDVPSGGETEFYYQSEKIKPEKGLTLIWPSDWTHTHRGCPLNEYDKYIISGWLSFL